MKAAIILGGIVFSAIAVVPRQQDDECAIYAEAIRMLSPDTTKGIVLYDSTSMGVPQFAFHAWTGLGFDPNDAGVAINRDMQAAMNEGMKNRTALPHVHWLNAEHTLAVVYAAKASDWLSGEGRIIVLSKRSGKWVADKSRKVWAS